MNDTPLQLQRKYFRAIIPLSGKCWVRKSFMYYTWVDYSTRFDVSLFFHLN